MRPVSAILPLLLASLPAFGAERLAGPVPAALVAVVDGDTLRVRAQVWLGQSLEVLVRIRGIDAPELRGRCAGEREMAAEAAAALGRAVGGEAVVLANVEGDKYFGRVVADVVTRRGDDLAVRMLASGLARAYDGGARQGWCAESAAAD